MKKISSAKRKSYRPHVLWVMINNSWFVAKSPMGTKLYISNDRLQYEWVNKYSYINRIIKTSSFDSEILIHKLVLENLTSSSRVSVPNGESVKENIFVMEEVNYIEEYQSESNSEPIKNIFNALSDFQLCVYRKNTDAPRLSIYSRITHNEFFSFYKNILRIVYYSKDIKSIFYSFMLAFCFMRLYLRLPKNKRSILTHGDLRSANHRKDCISQLTVRNLGLKKEDNEIFIFDFGSAKLKSKFIFKDIVNICSSLSPIKVHDEIISKYVKLLNKDLKYKAEDLNNVIEACVLESIIAQFNVSIKLNDFDPDDFQKFYKLFRRERFRLIN